MAAVALADEAERGELAWPLVTPKRRNGALPAEPSRVRRPTPVIPLRSISNPHDPDGCRRRRPDPAESGPSLSARRPVQRARSRPLRGPDDLDPLCLIHGAEPAPIRAGRTVWAPRDQGVAQSRPYPQAGGRSPGVGGGVVGVGADGGTGPVFAAPVAFLASSGEGLWPVHRQVRDAVAVVLVLPQMLGAVAAAAPPGSGCRVRVGAAQMIQVDRCRVGAAGRRARRDRTDRVDRRGGRNGSGCRCCRRGGDGG